MSGRVATCAGPLIWIASGRAAGSDSGMARRSLLWAVAIFLLSALTSVAADFDGDGVADEFTVTHDSGKAAKETGVKVANPWQEVIKSNKAPKGVGLVIRLSRGPQKFLVHDAEFFSSPMWAEKKLPVRVISKTDALYKSWKKQVPALKAEAIQLSTEAGIDILLYWDGRWQLFWPDEEP